MSNTALKTETATHTPGPLRRIQQEIEQFHVNGGIYDFSPSITDVEKLLDERADLLEVVKQFMSAMTTADFEAVNFNAKRLLAKAGA